MSTPAVEVEHVAKRYRIGAARPDYHTLRDRLSSVFKRKEKEDTEARELWALRDVSLTIGEGEAVGLIGHNGAGKSTLLKILSRITEPTSGRIVLHGRVASLLEVGTGFHPELTGRENVFLNGAILGMTREEIRKNFDAIVAFAGIERFLETPVKRYSSGMYVRLAFAVAAHLTPEILLVDEVLAVGDMEFQRRCLGRMNEVARSGRTVVFVSHNLASIESLCPRSILMSGGRVAAEGRTRDVLARYVSQRGGESTFDLRGFSEREGTGRVRITSLEVLNADGAPADAVEFRQPFRLRMKYEAREPIAGASVGFALLTQQNERVFLAESVDRGVTFDLEQGSGVLECSADAPNVLPGTYRFEIWISDVPGASYADHLRMIGGLDIVPGAAERLNVSALTATGRGHVYVDAEWRRGNAGV